MVKRILIITFIFILQFQYLSQIVVLSKFFMQQDYIAKVLCIKKNEKKNTCNGNCYLKMQLDKTAAKESDVPLTSFKFKFDFDWNVSPLKDNLHLVSALETSFSTYYFGPIKDGFYLNLIKPPTC